MIRTSVKLSIECSLPGTLVTGVGSAEETLLMVMMKPWDLLILDIMLPTRNGFEILKEVRRLHPETPVLIFSACDQPYMVRRARDCGATTFVSKSGSVEQLIDAVRTVLSSTPTTDTASSSA